MGLKAVIGQCPNCIKPWTLCANQDKYQMTKKLLDEIFSNSKTTKSFIALYNRDIRIDDFCVGYVIDFDDTFVVIQHVTKYGVMDGIHIKQTATLDKIETESDYLKTCQILFKDNELLPKQTTEKVKFSFSDNWQYHFLNDNSSIGELIAFDLSGEDFFNFGFLVDFDEDNFIIHLVGQSGQSQGTNIYHVIDISSFGIDTLECRKRKYLYNFRRKTGS